LLNFIFIVSKELIITPSPPGEMPPSLTQFRCQNRAPFPILLIYVEIQLLRPQRARPPAALQHRMIFPALAAAARGKKERIYVKNQTATLLYEMHAQKRRGE
jgi:hypothetical protein